MRFLALALLAACGGGQSPIGGPGGPCEQPNNACDPGLTCVDDVCIALDAAIGKPDAAQPFMCADDGVFEPNNSIQTAFQIPSPSISFAGLATCPAGDQDFYGVMIVATNQTLDAVITAQGGDPAIAAAILNAAGTAIANAFPEGPGRIRATVPNLPTGMVFVRVSSGGETNYAMTVGVTP